MAKKPKALILGVGAERGIGGAASRRFAREGYHVLVAGRTADKIDKVVDTIRKEGDPLRIATQLLDYDAKRVHYIHAMYHATEGYLAATNELMLMNIDYASRRAAPWPEWAMARIEQMAAAHRSLPRPPQAGRLIGIKRK